MDALDGARPVPRSGMPRNGPQGGERERGRARMRHYIRKGCARGALHAARAIGAASADDSAGRTAAARSLAAAARS